MKTFKLAAWALFTLAILVCAVSLIGQNTEALDVRIFDYVSPAYPKWVLLITCVVIGALLSSLFFIVELIMLETKNIRLRRLNAKLERALNLQTTPAANGSSVGHLASHSDAHSVTHSTASSSILPKLPIEDDV